MKRKPRVKKKKTNRSVVHGRAWQAVENKLIEASDAAREQQFDQVIAFCQEVTGSRKASRRQKAEAYGYMASAEAMRQNFNRAYEFGSKAIEYDPRDYSFWFNRGLSAMYASRIGHALKDMEQAQTLCDDVRFLSKIDKQLVFLRDLAQQSCDQRSPDFTVEELVTQEALFHQAFDLMQTDQLDEALSAYRRVIEMGDCLPQPWFNIGSILAERGQYDAAEDAWQRALVIEPSYEFAQKLLDIMPDIRENGLPPGFFNAEPLKGKVKNIGLHLLEE